MILELQYVHGFTVSITPECWASFPGEGIDKITINTIEGLNVVQNHSIYWLYKEEDNWILGRCSPYTSEMYEVIIDKDGWVSTRKIKFMPDLLHGAIKLGWWRPGEDRPE